MITARGLVKSFGDRLVLDHVDLDIADGAQVVILGHSGAGKTVLLKCLDGLVEPDSGTVTIDGERLDQVGRRRLYELRRELGYVFQASALLDSLTVAENILLAVDESGAVPRSRRAGLVAEQLARVGLEPRVAGLYPSALSGGMKKLAAIARALAVTPRHLLYDEPTAGLDPAMRDRIAELIAGLARDLGIASVVVTHDLALSQAVGAEIHFLKDGRLQRYTKGRKLEDFYDQ